VGGDDTEDDRPLVIMLCTGNASRSVMAGVMLQDEGAPVRLLTAGTHVVENQPTSRRTRQALSVVGLDVSAHRSRQITDADLDAAHLVVAMAAEHVRYVRRRHPRATDKTATLAWLAAHLPPGPASLATRVASLSLSDLDPADQGDVDDPAGGDDATYAACAVRLSGLIAELAPRLA
jgi:protein-tyrosine phosphatase